MKPKYSFSHFTTFLSRDSLLCPKIQLELIQLFRSFVGKEGSIHEDRLNFWFACEGLKEQTDSITISQMVAAIYQFLRKSSIKITNELRRAVISSIRSRSTNTNVFDGVQEIVGKVVCATSLRNFFNSYSFFNFVHRLSYFHSLTVSTELITSQSVMDIRQLFGWHAQVNPYVLIHYIRNRHMEWEVAWKKNFDQLLEITQ